MRYSFKVWGQQIDWPELREVWVAADRQGFWDAVWLNDHLYPPRGAPELPILDSFALLAGCAAATTRLRMGVMVAANTFRHPAILAKIAVTIDRMSGGRLELGVGTGWLESEHQAFDISLPDLTERFDRLEETFIILDGLMTAPRFTYSGRYYDIRDAAFEPKPAQQPRVPFVIGGAGMRRTLPLAARWADQWNFPDFGDGVAAFVPRVERLRELCAEAGRDHAAVEISAQFRYPGDLDAATELAHAYRQAGAEHVLVSFVPPADLTLPARLGEVLGSE
ncbi:MAG: TIGR03560 family F420-dependent LLM class oxidoreductase [Acidimicrobiia bacterium]|nr:TIGR03560 family F420-dependent LLM class oxidoreductase [Acidimicrobiia bacterium]